MARSTGRLSLAIDDYSDVRVVGNRPQTKERPRCIPGVGSTRSGAGPTHNHYEGVDVTKRTRPPGLSDSGTPATAVTITPASEQTPVTSTYSTR